MPALGLLVTTSLAAQTVPGGHYVVSSFQNTASSPLGGLAIVHPRTPGPATIVSGLPGELTGDGTGRVGANCVSYRPDDGFLLVGEISRAGETIELHELVVVGGMMVVDIKTVVGTAVTNDGAINQIAMLPNGDAVLAVANLTNTAPLFGSSFAYYDRSTATVSPISISSGYVNSIAVDPDLDRIYYGTTNGIFHAPLTGGGSTLLAPGNFVPSMALDQNGDLLVLSNGVKRIDVQTGAITVVAIPAGTPNGMFIERATGSAVVTLNGLPAAGTLWINGSTPQTLATNMTGVGSGVAVVDSAQDYGAPTPGASSYAFRTFPMPGGIPIAGNTAHAVAIDATSGPGNIGVVAANFSNASLPVLGINLLVNPTGAVVVGPFAPGTSVPLPIPAGLPPTVLFLQGIFVDAGNPQGFASTAGLRIETIL